MDAGSASAWLFSLTGMLVVLTAAGIIFLWGKKLGASEGMRKGAGLVAVLALVGAGVFAGLFGGVATSTATAAGARFTVTASEDTDQSQVVINDATNTVQVNAQFDISDGNFITGTGYAEVNFTIGRADTSTADATATTDILTIGQVSKSDGSGTTYPIVSKNADGTYKWNVEKGPNAAPSTTNKYGTVLVEGGGTNFLRLNITFNPTAAAEMTVYDSVKSTFTVAGETWTCLFVLVVKQA